MMTQNSRLTVLVTGANGFVGTHICTSLERDGHRVHRIQRSKDKVQNSWIVRDLASEAIPAEALDGVDVLVHLAAVLPRGSNETDGQKTAEMAKRIAQAAQAAGVKKFVHLSTVAARLVEEGAPNQREYGRQKREAELALDAVLGDSAQVVTLRPPLIYGANGQGPLTMLAGLLRRKFPLPVGLAHQKRCYLSVGNLCSLISLLLEADETAWKAIDRKTFEPHDGAALSTLELVRHMTSVIGVPTRILPVPPSLLRVLGKLTNKQDQINAMFEPLDCREVPSLQDNIGWIPKEHMPDSLHFLKDA